MPPAEQIYVSDLIDTPLPERLPADSQLKVWVRSTGYEVRFRQKKTLANPIAWIAGLLAALALTYFLVQSQALQAPYTYLSFLFPLAIGTIMLGKILLSDKTNVRLDITPLTIAISYLGERGLPESQEHVPLKEIESFILDTSRGLGLNSTISEILYRTWIGGGLNRDDLDYLARLIVQSSKLSMQSPHPGST